MKLRVAWIQARPGKDKSSAVQQLTAEYLKRTSRYCPIAPLELGSEAALLDHLAAAKPRPLLIALDSSGKQLSSEALAKLLDDHQTRSTPELLFAIGGADGFSADALRQAALTLSLGPMTLPHELARVVLLEQLYRAFTILKGHPYHSGH